MFDADNSWILSLEMVVVVVVVVAFPPIWGSSGECWTIHSPHALYFIYLFIFVSEEQFAYKNSTLYARVSSQWISDLSRVWPTFTDELRVSLFPWWARFS